MRREKAFRMNVLWAVFAAFIVLFAMAAYNGQFTQNVPDRLPSPYSQSIEANNTGELSSRYDVMPRAKFDEVLAKEHDVTDVTIYGHVPFLVISREDYMREIVVRYDEDPLAAGLPEKLTALKIKHTIKPAYTPTFLERQSGWFWGIGAVLLVALTALGIASPTYRGGLARGSAYTSFAPYGGLGLAGAPVTDDEEADPDKKTFDDVAGCEEAIAKLKRVRKWLRHPKWYALFKAKIPKGLLLVGPPGTGKTLLAQALAGETDANFFSISASEFVEMYVGVGASRVRKIFDKAIAARKKTGKPSIIFIDELDAVGKKRSGRGSGGDSERDQTLNQLLTCMQGFKPSSGILVIAATNLAETLDPALLRPGRFDYHVSVDYPDIDGREKIFAVHTRGMQLASNIRLRDLAIRTSGMAGAHIELVCSEAGVIAAERLEHLTVNKTEEEFDALPREVTLDDFDKAIDFVQFGDELLSRMRTQTDDDKMNTCVHEAGHAVVATATGGDPVTKITRSIRSKSLGMMQAHSENNRYGMKEKEMKSRIMTALGGQAAQLELLDYRDTGASNDFEQANRLARFMVGAYGMSELGPIQIKLDDQGFPMVPLSPYLASKFDKEWMALVAQCWEETRALVKEHRERIKRIADALMAEETILADRYRELYDGKPASAPAETTDTEQKSIPDATGYSI